MSNHAPQLRVSLAFAKAKDRSVEGTAGDVLDNLWGNANFPTPPMPSTVLRDARDAFTQAMADQAQGGTAATADKNNKREILIGVLRQLARYVEDNCANDLAKLLSSGFKAVSLNRAQSPLETPHIKTIKTGMSGQFLVQVTAVKNAKTYKSRIALIGADGTPGPWQDGGLSSNSRALPINGLTPGSMYMVQVRAVGGSTAYSDWSDPVNHMAV